MIRGMGLWRLMQVAMMEMETAVGMMLLLVAQARAGKAAAWQLQKLRRSKGHTVL
jgi:hypothetical protein